MRTVRVRNVSEALHHFARDFATLPTTEWRRIAPRGKDTWERAQPVCTVYERPWERVLLGHPWRDANPFFHLVDALWMLAGRNDVASLAPFNSTIGQFSDDGETFYGAYGQRSRNQVLGVIEHLRRDPDSRQAVIALWRPEDLAADSLDRPCNTHIYFKVRDGRLQMMVCCRSNDALWGAYGANAVQFSILQEYIAAALGIPMGTYRQVSDSLHFYTEHDVGKRMLALMKDPEWRREPFVDPYDAVMNLQPLVRNPEVFLLELDHMFREGHHIQPWRIVCEEYTEPFLLDTFFPMMWQHAQYRGEREDITLEPVAEDWSFACENWMEARQ
ncbi:MAG TPA: thymidylate synthase [Terriglobales bacterium]